MLTREKTCVGLVMPTVIEPKLAGLGGKIVAAGPLIA